MSGLQLCLIVWIMTIVTVYVGARIGLAVGKGKDMKLPNPVTVIKEHKAEMEHKAEKEVFDINMANIDIYDGTDLGQKDFR